MNIEIKDIITLNGNEKYVVCSMTEYEKNIYFYLINIIDYEDIKFGMLNRKGNKTYITEIEDKALIQQLLPLLYKEAEHIMCDEEI